VLLVASLLAAPAAAQEATEPSAWAIMHFSRVRLVGAVEAVGADDTLRAGFMVELNEGWRFYWCSAGENGFSLVLDWRASTNVSAADAYWPVPERLNVLGFETYGYSGDVPLRPSVTVADPGKPVELRQRANCAICSGEICTYHDESFAVRLPAGAANRSAHGRLTEAFSERVPKTGDAGLRIVGVIAMGSGKNRIMEVMAASEAGFSLPPM
jgi:suppressor for copper-sensitivity B